MSIGDVSLLHIRQQDCEGNMIARGSHVAARAGAREMGMCLSSQLHQNLSDFLGEEKDFFTVFLVRLF
jgi:hypothetical protein